MKNKKVLITGGAGFIGSNLADKLIKNNKIIVYDNFNTFYEGKKKNLTNLIGKKNFTLVEGDILNFNLLNQFTKTVDIVIHLAAQPGVRYSSLYPQITNNINVDGIINVLKASLENNVKKVIFASSSSVYGNDVPLPTHEDCIKDPISIYGASKLACEHYCKIYNNIFGLDVVILRYFTVYGPRQRPDMAIHKFVRLINEKKVITIYGDGKQTRDFTYIDDVIRGTIVSAERENIGGEAINIGSGKNISIEDLLIYLRELLGNFNIQYEMEKKGDVKHTLSDIRKAKKLLNYEPAVSIKNGLKKYIKWFKENH